MLTYAGVCPLLARATTALALKDSNKCLWITFSLNVEPTQARFSLENRTNSDYVQAPPIGSGGAGLIREKSHYTILPLESRNQDSAQIPGFWIPMVKWCNGIFL
jgi:hypothetical protein